MLLGNIMERLALIELKNLAIVDNRQIIEAARPEVISALNEAMVRLYSRFPLREKTLLIEQVMNIVEYKMQSKFAFSNRNNGELHHYIMDSDDEPYSDDLIKIISLWDHHGKPIVLNDISNDRSAFTPYPNTLLLQRPRDGEALSLTYQAMPEKIALTAEDTKDFELPQIMFGALVAYTAHQIFQSMGTAEAVAKSQLLLETFEAQCLEAQLSDNLSVGVTSTGKKFQQRGFV